MRAILAILLCSSVALAQSDTKGFAASTVAFNGLEFTVVELDLKLVDLKLYWKNSSGAPYQTLAGLRESLTAEKKKFLMATNSGIYSLEMTPLGLHVERGKMLRELNRTNRQLNPKDRPGGVVGNFSLKPNGVFFLTDKGAQILETEEFFLAKPRTVEATQSGPLLLRKGEYHPSFRKDSRNTKLRSGVGVTDKGNVVFAISNATVNFYDFAQFFKEKLHCTDALYLDGSISSLLTQNRPAETPVADFVGIWAATARD